MSGAGRRDNFDPSRSAPRRKPNPPATRFSSGDEPGERPGLAVRLVAARLLAAVVDARTSADGLTDPAGGHPAFRALDRRDQALVRAILATALRFRGSIAAALAARLDHPLPPNARSLQHILHVGAAQILHLDVPDSAAVDLAVAAASLDPRSRRFSALANAVLRRLSREKQEMGAASPRLDCPDWLFERLARQYGGERALAIAAAHRTPAALDLSARGDPEALALALGGRLVLGGTVRLDAFDGPVTGLAGFDAGEWWVQDAAAALPVRLLGDVAGRRIGDLCAAPGGKTAQLAAKGALVTALDVSANRMRRLEENLTRLGLAAETVVADLAAFEPPAPFDAVLLDAPCSSTGTIRRHPDVAWTKDAAEVDKLAGVQLRLLSRAAAMVAPGGVLVFSNCSLDRQEGEAVVSAFLEAHPDYAIDPVRAGELPGLDAALTDAGFLRTTPEMRIAPDAVGLDGFFAARLRRSAA